MLSKNTTNSTALKLPASMDSGGKILQACDATTTFSMPLMAIPRRLCLVFCATLALTTSQAALSVDVWPLPSEAKPATLPDSSALNNGDFGGNNAQPQNQQEAQSKTTDTSKDYTTSYPLNDDNELKVLDVDKQSLSSLRGEDEDLWQRIRQGFAIKNLDSPLVEDRTQWYAARLAYVQRMVSRSGRYLFHIVEELERRHMPTELALLPFVESAFNPQAYSSAKAAGMWQFIPGTGRDFNLKQNIFHDERRDVLASTRAALDYLQKLYSQFGDWYLALAAYNWGEGAVAKAINRNQRAGLPTDYLSLKMPNETRYYVPKLQAIKNLIAAPENFSLTLPNISNNPYFVTLTTSRDIDVSLAARLAQLPLAEFKALNPSFNRPVIIGATKPKILLPFKNAEYFQENLSKYDNPLASWTAVQIDKREKVDVLAKRLGVSSQTLRIVNNIPKGMRLVAGSTIVIPRALKVRTDISEAIVENAKLGIEPDTKPLRKVYARTRKHDTVATLAARYGVPAIRIRTWNNLKSNHLVLGKPILLYLPAHKPVTKKPPRFIKKRGNNIG